MCTRLTLLLRMHLIMPNNVTTSYDNISRLFWITVSLLNKTKPHTLILDQCMVKQNTNTFEER